VIAFHVVPEERARAMVSATASISGGSRSFTSDRNHQAKPGRPARARTQAGLTGRAVVLQTFQISRLARLPAVACCPARSSGRIGSTSFGPDDPQSYDIASLKRVKDDAREVREGMECGIRLDGLMTSKRGLLEPPGGRN